MNANEPWLKDNKVKCDVCGSLKGKCSTIGQASKCLRNNFITLQSKINE